MCICISEPIRSLSSRLLYLIARRRPPRLTASFLLLAFSSSRLLSVPHPSGWLVFVLPSHISIYPFLLHVISLQTFSLYHHYGIFWHRISHPVLNQRTDTQVCLCVCILHVCRARFYLPLVKSAIFSAKKPTSINSKLWGAHNTRLRGNCPSPLETRY